MREAPSDLRPWGYAPGHYTCRCIDCPQGFNDRKSADKRAWRCREHAIEAWHKSLEQEDAMTGPKVTQEPVAWMYTSHYGTEICRFRWGTDEGITSDHWIGYTETHGETDMSEEPKKCPFCDGEAEVYHHNPPGWVAPSVHIECELCGCGTCHHETRVEAVRAWNRRPT